MCVCSSFPSQLEFSDDIVRIIQTAINSDGGQPESRKANSMVKSFFIRVRTSNQLWIIWIISVPTTPVHFESYQTVYLFFIQLYDAIFFSDTHMLTNTFDAFEN